VETLSPGGGRLRPVGGFELYLWLFMRVSGVLLLLLALGHLAIMHLVHTVDEVDFAFVATRYRNPLWRMYDWFLLMLALVHGMNGLRVLIDDYLRPSGLRVLSLVVLYFFTFFFFAVGSYVILAFNPGG